MAATGKPTIDFEAAARRIVELTNLRLVRDELVLIRNARGAADIAKVESELAQQMGAAASGPYVQNLDRAFAPLRSVSGAVWLTLSLRPREQLEEQ